MTRFLAPLRRLAFVLLAVLLIAPPTVAGAATIAVKCMINPELGPVGEKYTLKEKVTSLTKVLPIFLTSTSVSASVPV